MDVFLTTHIFFYIYWKEMVLCNLAAYNPVTLKMSKIDILVTMAAGCKIKGCL